MRGGFLFAFVAGAVALVSGSLNMDSASAGELNSAFKLLRLSERHAKWYPAAGEDRVTIRYALASDRMEFRGARNCGGLQPMQAALEPSSIDEGLFRRELSAAIALWQTVIDVRFIETTDAQSADLVIGAQTSPKGRAFTNVETDRSGPASTTDVAQPIRHALICFNPGVRWKIGFDGNLDVYDLRYTLVHELGHALGLDHPGPSGQVMGYRYDERISGLQTGDIDGALKLYPASATARIARARAEREGAELRRLASRAGPGDRETGSVPDRPAAFGIGAIPGEVLPQPFR